jgi:hypothetical protein
MAIDVYSPCPGGTGKKLKFCCPNLLGDLEKVERMLDAEQYQDCLNHVQSLLGETPDRACLLAAQSLVLRLTEQWDAAAQAAAGFIGKHPDNPLAWGEMSITTARDQGGRAAMQPLQRALAVSSDRIELRVYEALGDVAEALVADDEPMAAMALLSVQRRLNPDDPNPADLLVELAAAPAIPLLAKSERQLPAAPADAPWKARYQEALQPSARGCWSVAAGQLTELIRQVGDQPVLWRALATLRAWLADTEGCAEALRKYASMDVPLEDAVEAQALALLLTENPLGDALDILSVTFTINDAEQLPAAFSPSRQVSPAKTDPRAFAEGDQPPPKSVYFLCDRAALEHGVEPTLENVPRTYCQALLFGRETDREARLELRGLRASALEEVKKLLHSVAGNLLGEPVEQKVLEKTSTTQELLLPNLRFPEGTSLEQLRRLADQQQAEALLNRWVQLPLGLLDGKTPQEAAGSETYRVRILGAIMLMASWFDARPESIDLNPLREKLGLPSLGTIDPQAANLRLLPLVRVARVEVARLDDEQLIELFHMATDYNVWPAVKRLSEAVFQRPSLAGKNEQVEASVMLARAEGPSDRGIDYLEQGRKMAKSQKRSCAAWDMLELSYRFARAEGQQLVKLINHIQSQHLNEAGVADALVRFMVQTGMIRPDGAVPTGPPGAAPEPAAGISDAPEPGKLWTPESQRPAEKQKIWTPGMD